MLPNKYSSNIPKDRKNGLPKEAEQKLQHFRKEEVANYFDVKSKILDMLGGDTTVTTQLFADRLIEDLRLGVPENYAKFVKNIKDGYMVFFYYRFAGDRFSPYELSFNVKDQTYGIDEFKKNFTSKEWKNLVRYDPATQRTLAGFVEVGYISTLKYILSHGFLPSQLFTLMSTFYFLSDGGEAVGEGFGFLANQRDFENFRALAGDVADHKRMYDQCLKYKVELPQFFEKLGPCMSSKWSVRRFYEEHANLSAMLGLVDRKKVFDNEIKKPWLPKRFYNDIKFPELKGTNLVVDGRTYHVKLINTMLDLYDEGADKKHCVFTYLESIKAKRYFVLSVTDPVFSENNCTAGFTIVPPVYDPVVGKVRKGWQVEIEQIKGRRNHTNFTFDLMKMSEALTNFLKEIGFTGYVVKRRLDSPVSFKAFNPHVLGRPGPRGDGILFDPGYRRHPDLELARDIRGAMVDDWSVRYGRLDIYKPFLPYLSISHPEHWMATGSFQSDTKAKLYKLRKESENKFTNYSLLPRVSEFTQKETSLEKALKDLHISGAFHEEKPVYEFGSLNVDIHVTRILITIARTLFSEIKPVEDFQLNKLIFPFETTHDNLFPRKRYVPSKTHHAS